MMRCLVACVLLSGFLLATADAAEPRVPAGFKLVFEEDFDSADALQQFDFSDRNAWRWTEQGHSGGALEQFQQSKYETKHRSPFNMALISTLRVGDFVMEADLLQTSKEYGHRDMCMYFGFQSPTLFYYTHLATSPDPNAHNIFVVNEAPRKSFAPIPEKGIDWGDDWKHVRLERLGDDIRVYFVDMDKPVLTASHSQFKSGHVGFGTFDDTGKVDNIRVWARDAEQVSGRLFSPAP
jgi:hypothetical protein